MLVKRDLKGYQIIFSANVFVSSIAIPNLQLQSPVRE